jgi:hypothetical protein
MCTACRRVIVTHRAGSLPAAAADHASHREAGTMDTREAYLKKLTAQLNEWQSQLNAFRAQAGDVFTEVRADYTEELESLMQQPEQREGELIELQQTSEQVWDDIKAGMDEAWERLEDALETAVSRFQ